MSQLTDHVHEAHPPRAARFTSRAGAVASRVARRPVLAAFVVALIARITVAIAVAVGWGGSLFLDDASFSRLAQAAADGTLHRLGAYPEWLYEHTAPLLVPISGLYEVVGPVKLAGQVYVALLGALTAALVVRLALEVVDRGYALAAGLIVALLPSQVLWSSIIMKDAVVWAVLAGLAVVVAIASRSTGRRLAVCGAGVVALAFALAFLRRHSLEVALIAATLAAAFSVRRQRTVRIAGALTILALVPLTVGMGVAGGRFVSGAMDPALQRALNAKYAKSAVVDSETSGLEANLAYLPKGITVVGLRPWPWEGNGGGTGVQLARAETLVWYPLLVLAVIGLASGWERRRVLAFPVLYAGGILVAYGLTEGNLGTAYRHRGEAVWAVAVLAALGLKRVVRGRRATGPEQTWPQAPAGYAPTRVRESSTAT
jgi:hypothetical protein